jgi:hypothetical protein
MSEHPFFPDWTAQVTLPVRRVDGRWEFFYGGDVPVKNDAIGELRISADAIEDERFRENVTRTATFKVLDEGTELLVALSDPVAQGSRDSAWPKNPPDKIPPGTTRFVKIKLGKPGEHWRLKDPAGSDTPAPGGLYLRIRGLERCELISSTVVMPEKFAPASAISLNHAYTLLSRAHETHRISNTGNVYTRMFYLDKDQRWYALDDLRRGVQAAAERTLIRTLWTEIENMLGWRPVMPQKASRRRR